MAGLVMGVVVMSRRTQRLSGLAWHAIGLASALGLYFLTSYLAFLEGCVLSLYTTSLWSHVAKRVTHYPPGHVLPFALLSWCLLGAASVWVVAYNFVPGGTLTRERTDVLLAVTIFLVMVASRDYDRREVGGGSGVKGEVSAMGEEGGGGRVSTGRQWRIGVRQRRVVELPPISEEEEDEEEEEVEGRDGETRDFEVDSTGSSVHEERAMELLATEEKECVRFTHRANKGTHTHSRGLLQQ